MIAPALIPLIGVAASFLLNKFMGGPSADQRSATAASSRASTAQAAGLEQQTALRRLLEMILTGSREMPRGEKPPIFQFGSAAGGPANDRSMYEGMQPSLSPEFQALMQLAGMSTGSGAVTNAAGLAQQADFLRQGQIGGITDEVVQSLMDMVTRGATTATSTAPPPIGPEGPDFDQFLNPPIDLPEYIPGNPEGSGF